MTKPLADLTDGQLKSLSKIVAERVPPTVLASYVSALEVRKAVLFERNVLHRFRRVLQGRSRVVQLLSIFSVCPNGPVRMTTAVEWL